MINQSVLGMLFLLFFAGCSVIPDKPFRLSDYVELNNGQNIYVIEYNDQGRQHLPSQRERLISDIQSGVTTKDLILFVHGWHHNANKNDKNYLEFKNFMFEINSGARKYTGVYIGWRGDQNDPLWIDGKFEAIDFLTLKERKRVSIKLGENGLNRLFRDMDNLISKGSIDRYVAIGHSLGGSAVFHASKDKLKETGHNLYILLNPAITDKEYSVVSKLRSEISSKPKLITLQAKNDFAITIMLDAVSIGKDAAGNSWAITHDLNSCKEDDEGCRAYLRAIKEGSINDECITVLNGDMWKITSRDKNGPGRETCSKSNRYLSWIVSADKNAADNHNGILTTMQASGLKELLEASYFDK